MSLHHSERPRSGTPDGADDPRARLCQQHARALATRSWDVERDFQHDRRGVKHYGTPSAQQVRRHRIHHPDELPLPLEYYVGPELTTDAYVEDLVQTERQAARSRKHKRWAA